MSRSSLSQFPSRLRAVTEHFPHANRRSFRVKKMILILVFLSESRRKPEFSPLGGGRFRPLFAGAQSTPLRKLANPLTSL
jgi:hypothetical protein